jgi:hypothetical protein
MPVEDTAQMGDENASIVRQRGRQERSSQESRAGEREAQVTEREAQVTREARTAEREARIAERETRIDERERASVLRDKMLDRRMIDDEEIYPPMDA